MVRKILGYDTRSYSTYVNAQHDIYELDKEATQALKLACLEKTDIDDSHVHFVQIDFSSERWTDNMC